MPERSADAFGPGYSVPGRGRPGITWRAGQRADHRRAIAIIDDFLAFAKLAPEAREAGTGGHEPGPFGPITAERATFSYPGAERVALHDISLRIEPGEVVALVGASGSGVGDALGACGAGGTYAELFTLQASPYQ
jgi:ABC-type multidrug transport system fused ATPase/permease subunit